MCVVSVAVILSFQLKTQPSAIERRIAMPLGIVFWLLSLVSLVTGLSTYLKTCARPSRPSALRVTDAAQHPKIQPPRRHRPVGRKDPGRKRQSSVEYCPQLTP